MKSIYSIIILLLFATQSFSQHKLNDKQNLSLKTVDIINKLDSTLTSRLQLGLFGSAEVGIIYQDQLICKRYYGWVDKAKTVPASASTLYMIGSISKSITGTVLARLVDQGVINLDDKIESYLPEIKNLKDIPPGTLPITFRQLASHTAGLANEPDLADANKGPYENWEQVLLKAISTTSLKLKPGEKYSYSNIGYGILGLAMSRATHQPFDDLIQEAIFKPLEMTHSRLVLSVTELKDLAINDTTTRSYSFGRGYKFPNGGVFSTLEDMTNFAMFQLGAKYTSYISSRSRHELQGLQIKTQESKEETYGYGLGLSVWTDNKNNKWVYHSGIVAPGYSATMNCDVTNKIAIIILSNDKGAPNITELGDEYLSLLNQVVMKQGKL